jgi:hypothetical protein
MRKRKPHDLRLFDYVPENEVGTAPPRGRPRVAQADAEQQLSEAVGHSVQLPDNAVVSGGPRTGWIEPDDPEPITWVRPYLARGLTALASRQREQRRKPRAKVLFVDACVTLRGGLRSP